MGFEKASFISCGFILEEEKCDTRALFEYVSSFSIFRKHVTGTKNGDLINLIFIYLKEP